MLKRYVLFILVCVFMIPFGVLAQCSDQRLAELNKIAGNVQVNYSYDVDENSEPVFSVYLTNVTPDIYVIDMFGNRYTNFESIVPSAALKLYVKSNDLNCDGDLHEITVNLPTYNYYSKLDECKDNNNPLCDIWLDTSAYTEDTFKQKLREDSNVISDDVTINEEDTIDLSIVIYVVIASLLLLGLIFVYCRFFLRRKSG